MQRGKTIIQRALKRPPLERLVKQAYRLGPGPLRRYVRNLAPQPRHYAPTERRWVIHGSLRWELFPAAYAQWSHYFGFSDPVLDVLRAFARRSRVIVDVGANVGVYSVAMAAAAGAGSVVHAIEPHPSSYRQLIRHRDLNEARGVVCHNLACGDRSGTATLFDPAQGDNGKASLRPREGEHAGTGTEVTIVSLDELVATLGLERLDLVKIDVEGHEPEVVLGAGRSIERFRPVLCVEVTPRWYRERPETARAAFTGLRDAGYRFFSVARPDASGPLLTPLDVVAFLGSEGEDQVNVVMLSREQSLPSELDPALA